MGKEKRVKEVDPSLQTRDIVRLLATLAVAIRNGQVPPLSSTKKIHIPFTHKD